MPGLSGRPHHNYDRHLRISQEDAWGVVNPSPSWQPVPILGDGYSLSVSSPRFLPETNFGGFRQQVGIHYLHTVEGSHNMLAWPEPLCFLLSAALDRDADGDLNSYTHDYYTPADPRRILGAVVDQLDIRATGTGDATVEIETGWMAREESRYADLLESDYDYSDLSVVPFMFRDARLWVKSAIVVDIASFTISVTNNVEAGPNYAGRVAFLYPGRREITLDLSKANIDRDNRTRIRSGALCSFEALFKHPAGHILQIQLPALAVEESAESASATEIAKEAPRMRALARDGQDIIVGCDLIRDGTTTMRPLTTTAAPTTTTTTAAL